MNNQEITVLQNILFPKSEICPETNLYFRANSDNVKYKEAEQRLDIKSYKKGERSKVTFDTYFNTFPLKKYKEYCGLSCLNLRVKTCGFFVLQIYGVRKTGDRYREESLYCTELNSREPTEEYLCIDNTVNSDFDMLYLSVETDNGSFYCAAFAVENNKVKINKVSIGAVICTYKREKFLLRNHQAICDYLDKSDVFDKNNIHFYIVDNGKTLDEKAINNQNISLIPNANTGGSGGFSRGYYEAANSGRNHTHILLMDDDILLDCEMLLRVYSLLRVRSDRFKGLSVGGTMLKLSDFVTQHEAGSYWDGKHLNSIGNGINMTVRENVFETVYYPKGNYNAWWFYCFPADWQKKHGYPLQFFVKEDDIEYSLRCAEEIAILNGTAVWHDDFEGKYDGFQEYYIKRNELIMTSVNHQKPYTLFQIRKLVLNVMKQTVFQRYFLADLVIRAYDDYLRGWEHFKNTDTEKLNRELMNSCEKLISDKELAETYGVYFDEKKYHLSMTEPDNHKALMLTLNGYLLPKVFYHKDKDHFFVADLAKCRYINFYKHQRVLHYDTANKRGFVTVQKRGKLFRYFFLLIAKSIKFAVLYPSVRRGYKKHLKELAQFKAE